MIGASSRRLSNLVIKFIAVRVFFYFLEFPIDFLYRMLPLKIRQLLDFFRYHMKLMQLQVSEKNRYQNCLTWSNFQIAIAVSDVFGKSAQAINQIILDNPDKKPNIEQLGH
ncbi:transposase [Streptococcus pseudoporcinus]|uniref:Transposase n=1 Tax=Streptococcus pseudoporcinus TaxID=361101 RepID=A0A4V6L3Y2_9STRE|nr:transposase [Streptococcus pseudoporcinus]